MQTAVSVKGTAIGYDSYESKDSDGNYTTMYSPQIEYTYESTMYNHTSDVSSSGTDFDIGEPVEILVNPKNPNDIIVNTFGQRWFVIVFLGIMGTIFAGMATSLSGYPRCE